MTVWLSISALVWKVFMLPLFTLSRVYVLNVTFWLISILYKGSIGIIFTCKTKNWFNYYKSLTTNPIVGFFSLNYTHRRVLLKFKLGLVQLPNPVPYNPMGLVTSIVDGGT